MTKLTVYHYAKCGTCRAANKWLESRGHELAKHDLFEMPPEKEELRKLVRASGLDAKKFFNTSGEVYKAMNLKEKLPKLSEEELLELLASNGRLVKRPIVTDGERVTVGFKEESFEEAWS